MTTVAAVDCGTNSIRLLVVRRGADGELTELTRQTRLARLGQGVDATGEFHPDALERANRIFEEYAELITGAGADRVRFVATSAARDVSNRALFEANVRDRLGVRVDVISGGEEANLSTLGVLSGVSVPTPSLVFDIGGGSTELIVVGRDSQILSAVSLNIGAVRMKERFLQGDPPSEAEVAAARAHIGAQLDGADVSFATLASAVGVAGTVTSFAAAKLHLQEYRREAVHETVLTRDDIEQHLGRWLTQHAAATAEEPCMHPLRAAVIGAGGLILDEISLRVPGGTVLVSETDILDGIALGLLED
ncbi:Ppx/GppA phosphatase family protein [Tessaracoccus lubricantis]|uniref:Ppx/GppA phosphatase family protein n=1 Tax=Tessaracoccus lubricantis TaxID=545543 RepID=A0ABP9FBE7_9ACTN